MSGETAKTILLVEDQGSIAEAETMSLAQFGYRVIVAHTGDGAIRLLRRKTSVDLVLMDIDLGEGIDGTQAAEAILRDHDIPIVFLSSHTDPETVARTERITSYGYVVKKSGITVLDASIKMAFRLFEANRKTKTVIDTLEATMAALPDILFEMGPDGLIHDFHSPRTELLYRPAAEIIGKHVAEIHPPGVAAVIMASIGEAEEKGFSTGKQFELAVPAGSRWFELSVSRKPGPEREPRFIVLKRDITGRKRAEEALEGALDENRGLLHELQHRVKNSFAMILGMVNLAAGPGTPPETSIALHDLAARIGSVSELYAQLYASGSFSEVHLDEYSGSIAASMIGLSDRIVLDTALEDIVVPANRAAPIGLILTELLTNVIKHAFTGGRKGRVRVSLRRSTAGAVLEVADDGIGLPRGPYRAAGGGMGLSLVEALAEQAGGRFTMEGGVAGTRCAVEFALAPGSPQ